MDRTAQGIASKGRFGDTTLVHMAPSELRGIEQLAGMPVTYNPDTGLPEMFNFKEFLAVAAPIAGAALLGPAAVGAFGSTLGATAAGALGAGGGAALGTLVAGGNSDEALQSGLITGLTAGIGGSLFGGKAGAAGGTGGGGSAAGGGLSDAGAQLSGLNPATAATTVPATPTPTGIDLGISQTAYPMANPVTPNTGDLISPGGSSFFESSVNANAGSGGQGIMGRTVDAFKNTQAYQNPAQALGYGTAGGIGGFSTAPMVANTLEDDSPKYGDVDMSDPYRRQVTFRRGLGSREGQFFNPSGMYIKEGGYIKNMQGGGTVGIVKGAGDGMSDSIYGTMRDAPNQRVALSDGEFVVPSDIVSGIGNGSTDAGAEKLYAMMDRVRDARTGTMQQAPEINPEEFLPA